VDHLIERKEIAVLLGVSIANLSNMAHRGLFPCTPSHYFYMNGNKTLTGFYPRAIILDWIEKRKAAA
jgi:hypothetical protein